MPQLDAGMSNYVNILQEFPYYTRFSTVTPFVIYIFHTQSISCIHMYTGIFLIIEMKHYGAPDYVIIMLT